MAKITFDGPTSPALTIANPFIYPARIGLDDKRPAELYYFFEFLNGRTTTIVRLNSGGYMSKDAVLDPIMTTSGEVDVHLAAIKAL